MCILILLDYPNCDHFQYVGSYNCPGPHIANCRRIYRFEDESYQCMDCAMMNGIELNTDINPVVSQPCTQGYQNKSLPQPTFEDVVRVVRRPSPASLSDVDSETSHWKLDVVERKRDDAGGMKPVLGQGENKVASKAHGGTQRTELTPQTAHRDLVQQQLASLANHLSSQVGEKYANVSLQPTQASDIHSMEENEMLMQQELNYGFMLLQKRIESTKVTAQTENPQPLQSQPHPTLRPENYFPPPKPPPQLFVPGRGFLDFTPQVRMTQSQHIY